MPRPFVQDLHRIQIRSRSVVSNSLAPSKISWLEWSATIYSLILRPLIASVESFALNSGWVCGACFPLLPQLSLPGWPGKSRFVSALPGTAAAFFARKA